MAFSLAAHMAMMLCAPGQPYDYEGVWAMEIAEAVEVTLSTRHGPVVVTAFQVGPLAAHPMLADDLPLRPDPANGYGVTLAATGNRISVDGCTFKGAAHAVAFIRALVERHEDWARWFDGPTPPPDLLETFSSLQRAAEERGELTIYSIKPA